MRSFEQRLIEIRRRSEALLVEKKKKQKKILTVCVALLLCGGIFAAFFTPDRKIGGLSGNTTRHDISLGDILYTGVAVGGTGEVTDEGISRRYSAAEEVRALMELFEKVEIMENSAAAPDNSGTEAAKYIITVTDSQGVQTEYLLQDGLLTNCTTEETFAVPEVELSKLKQLLGISDEG